MDDSEKMFNLIQDSPVWKWFPNNAEMLKLADHLLAHGVTIREPGGYSDDDCFREKIEHQLKGIYEHLRDVDSAIDTLRAQTLPLRGNVIPWFKEATAHINVGGSECHCGAPMKGESNDK